MGNYPLYVAFMKKELLIGACALVVAACGDDMVEVNYKIDSPVEMELFCEGYWPQWIRWRLSRFRSSFPSWAGTLRTKDSSCLASGYRRFSYHLAGSKLLCERPDCQPWFMQIF